MTEQAEPNTDVGVRPEAEIQPEEQTDGNAPVAKPGQVQRSESTER